MAAPSLYLVLAFYVVLVGLLMGLGAISANSLKVASDMVGAIVGAAVGVIVSMVLWQRVGRKMVYGGM